MTEPFSEETTWVVVHPDLKDELRKLVDRDGDRVFPDDYEPEER